MSDFNGTTENNSSNSNLDIGNATDGLEAIFDDIHNGKIKNIDDLSNALAGSIFMKKLGFILDSVDIANAFKSDNPNSKLLEVLAKIGASAKGGAYGVEAALKLQTAVPILQHPYARLTLIFAGALFGGVLGEEFVDMLFDASNLYDKLFDENDGILTNYAKSIFTISTEQAYENDGEMSFTIKLRQPLQKDLVLDVWTQDGSAKAGEDYVGINKKITIPANSTETTFSVNLLQDNINENDERFIIRSKIHNKDDFRDILPDFYFDEDIDYEGALAFGYIFDEKAITVSISNQTAKEGHTLNQSMDFTISLNRVLNEGEFLNLSVNGEIISFTAGQSSQIYTYRWDGNETKNEDIKFEVSASVIETSPNLIVRDINSGIGTIKDDDKDDDLDPEIEYSPIVIDLNGDGINSLPLDYTINFDLDNNGFKEATGWVSGDDALLAIDKNNNGLIDNGSELFGNKTKSDNYYSYTNPNSNNGFETLKEFDTNNDGIISNLDDKFDNLQIWQDLNLNGISEANELKNLSELTTQSLNLNNFTNLNLFVA